MEQANQVAGKAAGTSAATETEEEDEEETDLSSYSELQLSQMLASGTITSAQYFDELKRREASTL